MITLPDLLEDKTYRKYFCTVPKLPPSAMICSTPPWRVIMQTTESHRWLSQFAETYREAFAIIRRPGHSLVDGAIISRRMQFNPPIRTVRIKGKFVTDGKGKFLRDEQGQRIQQTATRIWKPKLDAMSDGFHYWCPYCRRPTEWRRFGSHPAVSDRMPPGVLLDPGMDRCCICGVSERMVTLNWANWEGKVLKAG